MKLQFPLLLHFFTLFFRCNSKVYVALILEMSREVPSL